MLAGLGQAQHRCKTGVAAVEHCTPFVACLAAHDGVDGPTHVGPERAVVLALDETLVQADALRQFGKELWFQRRQRNEARVGGFVGGIKRCTAIKQVLAPACAPLAHRMQAVEY